MIRSTPASKFIFVVGVWRSGTSLLYAMLNQHPQIALLYEAELFCLFPPASRRHLPADWPARLDFFNQTLSRHQLDSAALPSHPTQRAGLLALAQAWAANKGAKVIGDKSVACHMRLLQLAQIFPEADFIILWRNPLDTCRSVVNAGKQNSFFNRKGILIQTLFGAKQLADGVLKLRAAGRQVHEVVYDDLIRDPQGELSKICQFVGLQFDSQMLDLAGADCSMLPPGEHHSPVRSGAVQKPQARAEVLTPAFIAKGRRFATLWQTRYAQLEFVRTLTKDSGEPAPGKLEMLGARAACAFWDGFASFKHFILSRLPVSIWSRLRRRRPQSQPTDTLNSVNKTPDILGSAWSQIKLSLIQSAHLMATFINENIELPSLRSQFRQYWPLILANSLFLAAIIVFHFYCSQHLSFLPIYLIPCVWLTLKLDARWGAMLATLAACIPPWMYHFRDPGFLTLDVAAFNTVMRFILFQTIILLTSRIRHFHIFSLFKKSGTTPNFFNMFARYWAVILTSSMMLAGVAGLDLITSPRLNLMPVYLLPCVITTLTAGRSWGTAMAAAAAVIGPMMQRYEDVYYQYLAIEMWNTLMRFIIFQTIVVSLDHIHRENFTFLTDKLDGSTNLIAPK